MINPSQEVVQKTLTDACLDCRDTTGSADVGPGVTGCSVKGNLSPNLRRVKYYCHQQMKLGFRHTVSEKHLLTNLNEFIGMQSFLSLHIEENLKV